MSLIGLGLAKMHARASLRRSWPAAGSFRELWATRRKQGLDRRKDAAGMAMTPDDLGMDPAAMSLAAAQQLPPAPAGEKKDTLPRDEPDIDTKRERLVTAWIDKVKFAKGRWDPAFKRMRDDQEFAFGKIAGGAEETEVRRQPDAAVGCSKTALCTPKTPRPWRGGASASTRPAGTRRRARSPAMQSGAMMMQQGRRWRRWGRCRRP
jgi:hypothetical protein